jgi:hypothetical protein
VITDLDLSEDIPRYKTKSRETLHQNGNGPCVLKDILGYLEGRYILCWLHEAGNVKIALDIYFSGKWS